MGTRVPAGFLTLADLCERLGESRATVRRKYIKPSRIPIFREASGSSPMLVRESDFNEFMSKQAAQAKQRMYRKASEYRKKVGRDG